MDRNKIERTYKKWWLNKKVNGREIIGVKYIGNSFYGTAHIKFEEDEGWTPVFSYEKRPRKYNLILDSDEQN